jgi:hypothetical protein
MFSDSSSIYLLLFSKKDKKERAVSPNYSLSPEVNAYGCMHHTFIYCNQCPLFLPFQKHICLRHEHHSIRATHLQVVV